jgi:hypothetical protein
VAADTWGLSWGGTTGSWLTSWASTFVPPEPEPEPTQTPAGRKKRRRYFVEVDGQLFFADDESHARAILDRAAELAAKAAEVQAAEIVEKRLAKSITRKVAPVKIQAPVLTTSAPIDLSLYQKRIDAAYVAAAQLAEMRLMLERQRALEDEDEEEALLLLM